jgi:hypothetical protein
MDGFGKMTIGRLLFLLFFHLRLPGAVQALVCVVHVCPSRCE